MASTRTRRHINAPRAMVYNVLLDANAIATWRVPNGMTSYVHEFNAHEGGSFRVSLTYDAATGTGKTNLHTDTYHGRFVALVPNEKVIEVIEFETTDPALYGAMTITTILADAEGGTEILIVHEGIPSGLSTTENEIGTQMSLARLAALVETGGG